MSPRLIITGRKIVLPPYPPGSCVYNNGMGEEGLSENNPVQENEETVHKNENEDSTEEGDKSVHDLVGGEDPSLGSVETVDDNKKESQEQLTTK